MIPQTDGSLAMIKLSLKLKVMTSITKHHMCSFMSENDLVFILFFISVIFMQGRFVNSDMVVGCDDPTHNPSSVRILSLLTQFSGLTSLQSLVSGERLQGGLIKLGLVFEE